MNVRESLEHLAADLRADGLNTGEVLRKLKDRVNVTVVDERALWSIASGNVGPEPEPLPPETVGFSGARLVALLERPEPEPIAAGMPVPGHFSLWVAPAFSGKTSLALWTAMARAAGVAAWDSAPCREPGRVLLLSLDEAPEQVARRMRSLAHFHPAGAFQRYAERLVVIGPDREVDPALLDVLRFTTEGLAVLAAWARSYTDLFIDAYADVLPLGASENSNEEATRIGGALERIAVSTGAAIVVVHHSGKPKQQDAKSDELPDLTSLSRGASALAAKARALMTLETVAGMPHLRRLRLKTNLGPGPRSRMLKVCGEDQADEDGSPLTYFRAWDELAEYRPSALLPADGSRRSRQTTWPACWPAPRAARSRAASGSDSPDGYATRGARRA